METPETNVKHAAINLMRHKMLVQIAEGVSTPELSIEDVNEILLVAGFPVITPNEIHAKEVEVIKVERRADHDYTDDYDAI